ncbi:thiamine pyrophosphate-dependent enzyme [Haloferula sp. BvORR071]|uniref:thiamine pyrophosphate-dependent dehydrogenase E1 component subunit alpha n=1 Tax=Haloferula sp. BvORR071 TaxID=1396141 RepID=UPI00055496B2|nr:thiamine pyrophosphate-dependent enzyme [Haloferula sp. BvORR071]
MEDWRQHPVNLGFSAEAKVEVLRTMVRIRRLEQTALLYYSAGKMGGWLILSVGQESIAATARSLIGPADHTISGPRGMGHAIAAGMEMRAGMAELFGKLGGCSKGKGGAFSFYAPKHRHWGCHAIAATHTPLAAGFAFALKQRGEQGCALCFLGDGSVNQGVYHESLNLAGLFGLPVVYVIENNGYAMGTSVSRSSRFKECLARRAETYDIAWDKTGDGDLYELRARLGVAMERAKKECRPTVIEIPTYRYYGFSVADANHKKYRSPEEVEWMKANRDPLRRWKETLMEEGLIDEATFAEMNEAAKAEAKAAVGYAENSPPPGVNDIVQDVYWESDHGTEASKIGRHFFGE